MKISIKATNLILTPALKEYINTKVSVLGKYATAIREAKVEAERERKHKSGDVFRGEIMLVINGKILRAETSASDMYSAIDLTVPKLKEQISKFKDKKASKDKKMARKDKFTR